MLQAPDIAGASDVVAWFGYWPTFHDAEVLAITLDRKRGCRVAIHAFEMTPELDARGRYGLAKHAVVTFTLEGFPRDQHGITQVRLEAFNQQNVLSDLMVTRRPEGIELLLEGCFGVDGSIVCERMSVALAQGKPPV